MEGITNLIEVANVAVEVVGKRHQFRAMRQWGKREKRG